MNTMKSSTKRILLLLLLGLTTVNVFAQGPPPPPAVPLDGGITAFVALGIAGILKLVSDKKRNL